MCPVICISGIDTDIGKTVATGLMARTLLSQGYSTITQKIVQTGCSGLADDIKMHRKLMGIDLLPEDFSGQTCPYTFRKPCSPHLAAELEHKIINPEEITGATESLAADYEYVLLEGAGGLLVPLTSEITFLDYLQKQKYPLIIVTSSRLGSINHTLGALELAKGRGIEVKGVVYNCYGENDDEIRCDSRKIFASYLLKYSFLPNIVDLESKDTYFEQGKQLDCMCFF
ncbi:MAG TPA: ATP-dependent dethiobiotin synthetase BioD [Desulfobacterales bacterium]|nr:ATP-dependent dethiobiotin synthetase BioD [Desulfobacterales bacterium]HIP37838.1 ATP-dependent dethiobiotin synthetase BioD [Desulfocapsa sulfexigens]